MPKTDNTDVFLIFLSAEVEPAEDVTASPSEGIVHNTNTHIHAHAHTHNNHINAWVLQLLLVDLRLSSTQRPLDGMVSTTAAATTTTGTTHSFSLMNVYVPETIKLMCDCIST